jgi:CDP-diacylglycerol--serine O-phosphatidyltransferase
MSESQKTDRKKIGIYILPNLFTVGALFAGFYAVVAGMKGLYDNAAIAIFIAMLMDTLDGRVARLTSTQTEFGAYLDSLSDMVSFGIAPAFVAYSWALFNLGKLGWLSAFVYAVAVALRLARFNVQIHKIDRRYFQGLPCPPAAGVIAGMIWTCNEFGLSGWSIHIGAAVLTVVLGILMVSNIRYRSFKDLDLRHNVRFLTILIIVFILILIAIDPPRILFAIFFLYAISGPIMTFWQLRKRRRQRRK